MRKLIFVLCLLPLFALADSTAIDSVVTDTVVTDTVALLPEFPINPQQEFIDLVTGGLSGWWYLSAFFFALLGFIVRWYIRALQGIKNNPNSPAKFDWKYWWQHNKMKIAGIFVNWIIVFLCLRFSQEWFGVIPSMILAVTIGICFDWFFNFIVKLSKSKPNV